MARTAEGNMEKSRSRRGRRRRGSLGKRERERVGVEKGELEREGAADKEPKLNSRRLRFGEGRGWRKEGCFPNFTDMFTFSRSSNLSSESLTQSSS